MKKIVMVLPVALLFVSVAMAQSWDDYGYNSYGITAPWDRRPTRMDYMERQWDRTYQQQQYRPRPRSFGNPNAWGYDQSDAPYGRGLLNDRPITPQGGSLLR